MSLTYLNCNVFRGSGARNDSSNYVVLNPRQEPGSLVIAISMAAKDSISGQVACKLGLEHFVDGVLDFYEGFEDFDGLDAPTGPKNTISLEILESAFKKANTSVYQFAHKLSAGGRMASTLLGVVLEDKVIAAGKVGPGNVLLHRDNELFCFFEDNLAVPKEILHETFIGAHSAVSVELATLPAKEGDRILIFPFTVDPNQRSELQKLLNSRDCTGDQFISQACKHVFQDVYKIPFAACATIGPETIYLAEAV